MTGVNWPALILFLVALYGVWEHLVAVYDAILDRRAMKTLHHTDELAVYSVNADIRDELWRVVAKVLFTVFFLLAMQNPRATVNDEIGPLGWVAFLVLLGALLSLTVNTMVRKRARHFLLVKVLVRKGQQV